MSDPLDDYRAGRSPIPAQMPAWQVFGVGLQNVGKQGRPLRIPVPEPDARQVLGRLDAAGLCFSDIKILRLGANHPRLHGRDLAADPIVMGHEASVTIVKVGEDLRDEFAVGDRFVVQAEIYYKGENLAFGYLLPGALQQYVLLGDEILRGDEGLYLVPVDRKAGYAETALAEPWACVVHSYRTDFRRQLHPGGTTWLIAADAEGAYSLGRLAEASEGPSTILVTDLPDKLLSEITAAAAAWGAEVRTVEAEEPADVGEIQSRLSPEGFDDVIIVGHPPAELVGAAAAALSKYGTLALVIDRPLPGPVSFDLGRIHYDYVRYLGSSGGDVSAAYADSRDPALKPGGKALMTGGAGPMGQMHVQLALESQAGPELVVVTDIDQTRLELTAYGFGDVAREHDKRLVCLNPEQLGEAGFDRELRALAPQGFDDIVILVPSAGLVLQAVDYLADGGVMNMFAGIPKGTICELDLSPIALRGLRLTGTSGSRIADLQTTVRMTEDGELSPNRSVAAVGGIEAAHDGLRTVRDGLVPGKIVIYPQIQGLPLTPLSDLDQRLPEVAAHLGPGCVWTNEAEAALLRWYLTDPDRAR